MKPEEIELVAKSGWMGWFPEGGLKAMMDPENARISQFLKQSAGKLQPGSKVLDASAGQCPYRGHFDDHHYESCDIPGGFYSNQHDFECFLEEIPRQNAHYDAVILTQVLEHVANPEAVLKEICRVLKSDGVLLLSVPMNCPLHGLPWHFFQFTHFGLAELAKSTGFKMEQCEKVGGAFWFYGKNLQATNRQLMKSMDPFRAKKRGKSVIACAVFSLLYFPVWLLMRILLSYLFRPLCYWLDRLDSDKLLTLGYTTTFRKF